MIDSRVPPIARGPSRKVCLVGEQVPGPSAGEHIAHLYTESSSLVDAVSMYAQSAAAQGSAIMIVATPAHRAEIQHRLKTKGIDAAELSGTGQFTFVEAEGYLDQLVKNGVLQTDALMGSVEPLIEQALARFNGLAVYGEGVNLLWQRRRRDLALQLEEIWNGFIERYRISLMCSYRTNILDEAAQEGLAEVCQTHTHVIPDTDAQRFERAVDQALREAMHTEEVGMLRRELAGRCKSRARLPEAQAAIFALCDLMPSLGQHVRMLTRSHYDIGGLQPGG